MPSYTYKVVDVFTDKPLKGNPVAVILDARGLDADQMQAIARWTNLSETTFVFPPENGGSFKIRIFCPTSELPFAGHPTLGTCHALIEAGIVPDGEVIQECGRGNVPVKRLSTGELQFSLPVDAPETFSEAQSDEVASAFKGLKIRGTPAVVNSGPVWTCLEIENSAEELLKYEPSYGQLLEISKKYGWVGFNVYAVDDQNNIELRTFAPAVNVPEDPVCGSGNASVAQYRNIPEAYVSHQGRAAHRDGVISAHKDGNLVRVGGKCVTCVNGTLNL